jgi:hypothetical protein
MKLRNALIGGALAGSLLVALPASPASAAATPQCTRALDVLPDSASGGLWAPVSSSGTSYCWMDQGNVSRGVWALQRALRFCYHQNIAVDSDYGPRTKAALRTVQGQLGISADGVYGRQTRSAMKMSSINTDADWACSWLSGVG